MATGELTYYDPSKVKFNWGLIPLHEGIAKGTFVTQQRDTRTWRIEKGCDGDYTRVRTNDFLGTVKFTIRGGSRINLLLHIAQQVDELTGLGISPYGFGDFSGSTSWASPIAYLDGPPVDAFGDRETNRVWTLICCPIIPLSIGGGKPLDVTTSGRDFGTGSTSLLG